MMSAFEITNRSQTDISEGRFCMNRPLAEILKYHCLTDDLFSNTTKVLDYGLGDGTTCLDIKTAHPQLQVDGLGLTHLSDDRGTLLCSSGINVIMHDANTQLPADMNNYDIIFDTYGPVSYSLTPLRALYNAICALKIGGCFYCYCTWGERILTLCRFLENIPGIQTLCPAADRLVIMRMGDIRLDENTDLDIKFYYRNGIIE